MMDNQVSPNALETVPLRTKTQNVEQRKVPTVLYESILDGPESRFPLIREEYGEDEEKDQNSNFRKAHI